MEFVELGEFALVVDLVLAVGAALVGGVIANRLRQPVVLGYLIAGIAIGPFTPGPVGDVHRVQVMAEMGVAFLMFALGAEVSLGQLRDIRKVAVFGGIAQILLTIGVGTLIGPVIGLDFVGSIFLGSLIALSSTMVAMKILISRGELGALHGRIALGFLIVQDISVVPMVVIFPALAGQNVDLVPALMLSVGKAAVFLIATYYLGTRLVPWILHRVAATRSRELFLLTIVSLALGTALGTYSLGLSLAFGAFIAGLVVSESDFSHQIVAEVLPLRDIFATIFFVSVGMLINPLFLLENVPTILLLVAAVVVGKFLICLALPVVFGYSGKTAVYSALALIQIGEFSFVLAKLGVDKGLVPDHVYSLTLAGALVTILLTPLGMYLAPFTVKLFQSLPVVRQYFLGTVEVYDGARSDKPSNHVVILGYGDIGRELADALERRGFKYVVVEYNPHTIELLRQKGAWFIYGDASNPEVLAHANLPKAKFLAITLPDFTAAEVAVRNARRIDPKLDIFVRAHSEDHVTAFRAAGADSVVRPEFEAGLEFIRHAMHRYGVTSTEIQAMLQGRRHDYQQRLENRANA
ncbi:MAG: cation:proton antiporter [Chloroflexi bacterium]|nr:cation:proton antiporter [Chloroflexota bacterium]